MCCRDLWGEFEICNKIRSSIVLCVVVIYELNSECATTPDQVLCSFNEAVRLQVILRIQIIIISHGYIELLSQCVACCCTLWIQSNITASIVLFDIRQSDYKYFSVYKSRFQLTITIRCCCTLRILLIITTRFIRSVQQCQIKYCDMGWLRLVGSIKLQVFFAEYCLFYRALL